jgi:hypothetical protein
MMKRPLHKILRLLLVFIPVLLVLAPARAQVGNWVYAGQSSPLTVVAQEGVTYYWELYNDVNGLNLAVVPGNCPPSEAYFIGGINSGDSVEVMWLVPGIYFFKVTATDSCTNNLKVGKMEVLVSESYAEFLDPNPICPGDTALLTMVFTGAPGPWDVTFTDGTDVWTVTGITASPYTFQLIPSPAGAGNYMYWITSVTNSYGIINNLLSDPVTLTVRPKPVTSPIYTY